MQLTSITFDHNGWIPEKCAFGIKDDETRMALGENKNPELTWSNIPDEAQSLVLICVDTDVPSSLENFNKEGKVFFEKVYESQKKRIFNALKNSEPDSVIKFKEVLNRIIDGKK